MTEFRRPLGVLRIFLYNWPTYVAVTLASLLGVWLSTACGLPLPCAFVASSPLVWAIVSLLVAFWVYDVSDLATGQWVSALLPARCATWVTIDVGLDAEVSLASVPGCCLARFDVFDPQLAAPSVARARARTPRRYTAISCSSTSLPLNGNSCDVVFAVFALHEQRDAVVRERAMHEIYRVLAPIGRLIVVEHPRDVWNFMAFGPGFLHFQPAAEWLQLAQHAGFGLAATRRITPWVRAWAWEKNDAA